MCYRDLTSASVFAAFTKPPKKVLEEKIFLMTTFLTNSAISKTFRIPSNLNIPITSGILYFCNDFL